MIAVFVAVILLYKAAQCYRRRRKDNVHMILPETPVGPATPTAPAPAAPVENAVPAKPLIKAAPSAHDPLLYDPSLNYNDIGFARQRWKPVKNKLPKKRVMSRKRLEHAQNIAKRIKTETAPGVHATSRLPKQNDKFSENSDASSVLPKQKNLFEKPITPPAAGVSNRNHHLPDADYSNRNTAVRSTDGPVNVANALRENYFALQVPTAAEDFFHPKHVLPTPTATTNTARQSRR